MPISCLGLVYILFNNIFYATIFSLFFFRFTIHRVEIPNFATVYENGISI